MDTSYHREAADPMPMRPVNFPRTHSRSASWSPTAFVQRQQLASQSNLTRMLSPIRSFGSGLIQNMTSSSSSDRQAEAPAVFTNSTSSTSSLDMQTADPHTGIAALDGIRSRSEPRGITSVSIDMGAHEIEHHSDSQESSPVPVSNGNNRSDHMEFFGAINWIEKSIPFIILLVSRFMWDHRLGLLVFVGLFGTHFHMNSLIRRQVALKERRLNIMSILLLVFLTANISFIYYVFKAQQLQLCLTLKWANFHQMDLWTTCWCIVITDFVVRFGAMSIKCLVIVMPRRLIHFRKRGKYFLLIEQLSQMYRILLPIPQWYCYFAFFNNNDEYFAMLSTAIYLCIKLKMIFDKRTELWNAISCLWSDTRYGRMPTKNQLLETGDSCPICQETMDDPIELSVCKHIFCEDCIVMWFDRERTCPMCRAKVAEDPCWRDGNTQAWVQLF